jgi:hypothetical protein
MRLNGETTLPKEDTVKKFRTFLKKKYKVLLPVLGAGVVLATFVVRETWREDLKDFVGALDNAVGVFVIRTDFNGLLSEMRVVEQKVDRVEQLNASSTRDPFTLLVVNQQLMIFRELHDGIATSLDSILRLSQSFAGDRQKYFVYRHRAQILPVALFGRRREDKRLACAISMSSSVTATAAITEPLAWQSPTVQRIADTFSCKYPLQDRLSVACLACQFETLSSHSLTSEWRQQLIDRINEAVLHRELHIGGGVDILQRVAHHDRHISKFSRLDRA